MGIAVIGLVIALTLIFTTPGDRSANPPSHPSSGTSSAGTPQPSVKLTVKVVEQGTNGLSVVGSPVKVLQNGTLASVASGTLNSALEFAANVRPGEYQVCINPPIGWNSATRTSHVLAGWICSAAGYNAGPLQVTFRLTPQIPQAGQ